MSFAAHTNGRRIRGKAEPLHSVLLVSISHDLKTPLASIIGSVTSLRRFWATFDDETRNELLGTIQEEAERPTPGARSRCWTSRSRRLPTCRLR